MTVNKAVTDEQADQALGVLSRRYVELVQRIAKGALPKVAVLRAVQEIINGEFEHYRIRGFNCTVDYHYFDFLPPGCHPNFYKSHCIEIPSSTQLVDLRIFLLTFHDTVTLDARPQLIQASGFRPALSFELQGLVHYLSIDELLPNSVVAMGSVYLDEHDKADRVLVSRTALRSPRNRVYRWIKPEELSIEDVYVVVEAT